MDKRKFAVLLFTLVCNYIFADNVLLKKNENVQLFSLENRKSEESVKKLNTSDFIPSVQSALSNSLYMVTAGDTYILAYTALNSAVSYNIAVDASYKIRVANLAILDAKGKTYLQLKKEVEEIVQKNYPMSGVQFTLTQPATFKVTVRGEVENTYEQEVWALTRLSSVILDTEYSSLRDVTITSENGKSRSYDVFKAKRFGDLSQDPYLRPNDIITVNHVKRVVSVSGAVERPGDYQLLDGENLKDLINYYGNGLAAFADVSRIELTRTLDATEKAGKKFYLSDKDYENNYELLNYDSVFVPTYESLKPVMFIEGAIGDELSEGTALESSNRAAVRFEVGTNLATLVRDYSERFPAVADIQNSYIIRGTEIIKVDLGPMLYDAGYYSDVVVQPNDILRVPFKQFFVTVSGSVYNPGRYPYIPDRTYDYYIALAGGFIKSQNSFEAVKITDINGNKLNKNDVITPECIVRAETNSFIYYLGTYSSILATVVTLISNAMWLWSTSGIGKK